MNSEALLHVDRVTITYRGGFKAVDDVTFSVGCGQVMVLLGANGSGKSSLLRSIAGLHSPASGELRYLGQSIGQVPAHRGLSLGISLVPEGRRIYPDLSVNDNLRCGFFASGSRAERKRLLVERTEQVLDLFPDLSDRLAQTGGSLSGGQQQMLAIGRGLMSAPQLLMLDEPSLGVAPTLVGEIYEALDLLRQRGTSILLVEQYAALALDAADHAVVLANGRVVSEGTPDELRTGQGMRDAYF
ncbi:ABC transporter ATP-binding protein [Nocardioides sp. AE5]|uniref:ABC transporter ATP-binding protein n=1 Tax=Nocardioides sp. AE5 TaxID=2962573 RepID=UPI00288247A1|nr:ABC transporter ATP-binding protein [Nocardioides sp. AE5]MDT0200465.1 ABC transporter ATP-binding protein [Nocardioides sp. AE5]